MITVTIKCDHAGGARCTEGKPANWCRSHTADGNISADHSNATQAASIARNEARGEGWRQTKINANGKHGWLCPPCYQRAYGE